MNGRTVGGLVVWVVASALVGCGDRPPPPPLFPPVDRPSGSGEGGVETPNVVADAVLNNPDNDHTPEGRAVVLDSVVRMLQRAALDPGGDIFTIATERLNHYFAETPSSAFALSEGQRDYLKDKLPPPLVEPLERREYTIRDARHIEDCMLYRAVANRVAGDGDDLTRTRRVFDWMVRQVQLVPLGSLAPPGLPQAAARPYDVLLRGMATEPGGLWAERGWLFAALCRQLGLDAALLVTTPKGGDNKEPVAWAVAVLIDGTPYLFDARIGLPVPGPDGRPVATLEEAIADPTLLSRLSVPGLAPYPVNAADVAAGPIDVMIDATPGYLSPRMRALEAQLSGRNRLNVFRDPSEQRAAFAKAFGPRLGEVRLWPMTYEVEIRLFTDPQFVAAAQYPIQRFDSRLPLLSARMAQLRGDLEDSIQAYVALRFNDNPLMADRKTPIPSIIQHDLDMYATYFLGLSQLEAGHDKQAEFFFHETVRLLPEPKADEPVFPYAMYRWGALTNLGLLSESRGDRTEAIRLLCADTRTAQNQGNLVRARDLIWQSPFTPPPAEPAADATAAAP